MNTLPLIRAHIRHLARVKEDAEAMSSNDEVVIVDAEEPRPKRQKLTDFFQKVPATPRTQEFPGFLRRFQPTDMLRRAARPAKRPVGRPRKASSSTESTGTVGESTGTVSTASTLALPLAALFLVYRSSTRHISYRISFPD